MGLLDFGPVFIVEQHAQTRPHRHTQVMAAVYANAQILFQLAVENHLAALGALMPQVVGHLFRAHQLLNFGPDEIG